MLEGIVPLLITIAIIVALFLIFREVVCWYWKINQFLGEFRTVAFDIRAIRAHLTGQPGLNFTEYELEHMDRIHLASVAREHGIHSEESMMRKEWVTKIMDAQSRSKESNE